MANDTLIQGTTLTAIADAIRAKDGSTAQMYPSEMAGKIAAIETVPEGTLMASDNTVYTHPNSVYGNSSEQTIVSFIPKFSGTINISGSVYASGSSSTAYVYAYNGTSKTMIQNGSNGTYKFSKDFNVTKDTEFKITERGANTILKSLVLKCLVVINEYPFI